MAAGSDQLELTKQLEALPAEGWHATEAPAERDQFLEQVSQHLSGQKGTEDEVRLVAAVLLTKSSKGLLHHSGRHLTCC